MTSTLPPDFKRSAEDHGIDPVELERQWARLQQGPSHCTPDAPCQRGQGIQTLSPTELERLSRKGAALREDQAVRLVPASGAASRMFKALATKNAEAVEQLDARWAEFPFHAAAEATGPTGSAQERLEAVMERLAMPAMPKGGLDFHLYPDGPRTAFEEHMREWRATLPDALAPSVHFTLPAQGREDWAAKLGRWAGTIGVTVTDSVQHPSTDTMAVDADGRPFLMEGGAPLFRPGGHGALLRNLSDLACDHPGALISVKNIDNVRPMTAHDEVLPWRRALLGLAAELDEARKEALRAQHSGNTEPAVEWLRKGVRASEAYPEDQAALAKALDRPLLVAGMVRNEGEPGGGPFWLRDDEGVLRAQIVESAEMDLADPRIGNCIAGATHFNPVDLVCAVHDSDGRPYDLSNFVDGRRDFLVSKSHGGRPLIGLEHPGLWNGAMGRWNTLFVEVPSRTFAPVKTVFDLLRPAHRV